MLEEQLIRRGIRDSRVLSAFGRIERHRFVFPASAAKAYEDFPIPIGEGQTISQPYMTALMTESLYLTGKERVLEIGTGSGYQAAILAETARQVYTIERHPGLSRNAEALLSYLGYKNITLKTGDGTQGWPEESPFDGIVVTASVPQPPQPLLDQLTEGGRLVIPLGERNTQTLTLITKSKGGFQKVKLCECIFVPLIGKYAWEQG